VDATAPVVSFVLDGSGPGDADCTPDGSVLSVSFPLPVDAESGVSIVEWGVARRRDAPLALLDVLPLQSFDGAAIMPRTQQRPRHSPSLHISADGMVTLRQRLLAAAGSGPLSSSMLIASAAAAAAASLRAGDVLYSVVRVTNGAGIAVTQWTDGLLLTCDVQAADGAERRCLCTANTQCAQ